MKNQKPRNLKKRRRRGNEQYAARMARKEALLKRTEAAEGYTIVERSYGFGLYYPGKDKLGRKQNKKVGEFSTYEEAVEASHNGGSE